MPLPTSTSTLLTAEGNHLKWLFAIKPNTAATKGDAVDFVNSHWRDGTVIGSGAIYTAIGVRPVGFLPPSFDEVRSSVGSSVDEACLLNAYTKSVDNWNKSKKRFAGATIQFSGWAHDTSGDTKAVTYTGSGYVYSNEIGAFQKTTSAGAAGTGFNGSTSNAVTFFNAQLVGLVARTPSLATSSCMPMVSGKIKGKSNSLCL